MLELSITKVAGLRRFLPLQPGKICHFCHRVAVRSFPSTLYRASRYSFRLRVARSVPLLRRDKTPRLRATIERIFDELLHLSEELTEEEVRYVREGFSSDEELALYDLLFKQNLSKAEIEQLKRAATQLLQKVKAQIARLHRWYEKDTTIAQVRTTISEVLYDGLPESAYPEPVLHSYEEKIYEYVLSHYKSVGEPTYAVNDSAVLQAAERV